MPLAGELWHQTEKGNFTLLRLPEVEFQNADLNSPPVKNGPNAHHWVMNDLQQIGIAQLKP